MSFATVDDLAALLGRQLTSDQEVQAQLLLDLATAEIRNHTRQHLEVKTHTQRLHGTWSGDLELPQRPVISVESVKIEGEAVTDYQYDTDGVIRRVAGALVPTFDRAWAGGGWGGPRSIVEVVYMAGWDPLPIDIRGVCLSMAVAAAANPTGVAQESIGSYSVSYRAASVGVVLTADHRKTLHPYRRWWA